MTRWLSGRCATPLPLLAMLFCGFGTEQSHIPAIPLIVTAAPAYDALAAFRGGERFPRGAQLLLVKDGEATRLVDGFEATADASVSFDAQRVLFAGKKATGDPWAIWELTLGDHTVRKVIAGAQDAVRPLYLPGERLVFAQRRQQGFQLVAAALDGAGSLPLTYAPGSAIPDDVLADGRILFESGFPLGEGETPEIFLVYSDGSGVESYRCDHGVARWGGRQMASGDVVFTHGAGLARFTSPLGSEARITAPQAEYSGGIAELEQGNWLISARKSAQARYALQQWKPGARDLTMVYSRAGEDLVDPVLLRPRPRPNKHPSALHGWDYANLLALDARQSREGAIKGTPATVRVQALDETGKSVELGAAPVEPDGSFFLRTPADRPIRFSLLDSRGTVLRQEKGWFWARRGEQRICVGCHAGPERAPENRVPQVLLHNTEPVDLCGAAAQPNAEGH